MYAEWIGKEVERPRGSSKPSAMHRKPDASQAMLLTNPAPLPSHWQRLVRPSSTAWAARPVSSARILTLVVWMTRAVVPSCPLQVPF